MNAKMSQRDKADTKIQSQGKLETGIFTASTREA